MSDTSVYDIIIIGGGPAGMNAALYAGRGGMKCLLIEKTFCGGQASTAFEVENYIGLEGPVGGPELSAKMEAHARRFGAEIINTTVERIDFDSYPKQVHTTTEIFEAKTVILCMGANRRGLGVKGENRLRSGGVSYCATCDGAFFRGKEVCVVGGGDTAAEDALFLSKFCTKVTLIHRRDSLRAAKVITDALLQNPKIEVLWDSVVTSVNGEDAVESVSVKNLKTEEETTLNVRAMFVAVGTIPANKLAADRLELSEEGYIITDEEMRTKIPGVFAAGDIRQKAFRQIITAAADGAIAINSAILYINEHNL